MRGTLKTSTLESKFPLLAVEGNCILSKFADVTAAFRVTLPELFTLTAEEYEALHATWVKALKVLPDHTVVHKQDLFIEERYETPEPEAERTFLSRAYERHFNERPFLRHTCHLFITKSTPERLRQTSAAAVLCRGFIIPQEIRQIEHDPMRIKQILNNFISNALKNTVQGHIEVYYETDTDGIRISVSDTGCGIPPDKLGMIFERFEKVDSFAQGAGLGLSICKSIVEKMNGVITVDSTMGVGSTFTVELPCRTRPS